MKKRPANKTETYNPERALFESIPDPLKPKNANIITVPAQIVITANDGYSNQLAYLGAASPTMSAGTFVRSGLTEDREELTTAYRECAIAKRIIDRPSEDMTRGWYTLSGSRLDEEDLRMLKELETKHSVKQEITNAIRWARLYGGSLAIMIIRGEEDKMDQPLDLESLVPDCFKGIYVADLTQGITPSLELEENLDDPDYELPKYYDVEMEREQGQTQCCRIHHSRVLRFTGRELPHAETVRNSHWGASELEHPWDEIRRYLSTCENIAQLVYQANLITLKIGNFGSDLAYGSDRLRHSVEQAAQEQNRMRTSFGIQMLGTEDSMENHSYNFAGLAENKESFMMDIAGAAEIPAAILFGRSPQGMNATGEFDTRNYYDMISQQQERLLRPALEKLLPVMAASCWGFIPDDLKIVFNPMMTISPEENARLSRESTGEIIEAVKCGLVTPEEGRAELIRRGKAYGNWGNIA